MQDNWIWTTAPFGIAIAFSFASRRRPFGGSYVNFCLKNNFETHFLFRKCFSRKEARLDQFPLKTLPITKNTFIKLAKLVQKQLLGLKIFF